MSYLPKQKRASLVFLLFLASTLAFAAPKQGTIAGVIADASGANVSAAHVLILSAETHEAIRREMAAGDGSFHINLPEGKYQVQFSCPGFRSLLQDVAVQGGKTVTLSPVLQLKDQGSGSQFSHYFLQKLHVTDPSGAEIPGAAVLLRQHPTDRGLIGFTNPKGEVVLNILALEYQIEVSSQGFQTVRLKKDLEETNGTLDVQLPIGQCSPCITVTDSHGHAVGPKPQMVPYNISGDILDIRQQLLAGVVVEAYRYDRSKPLVRTVTDANGHYALHFQTKEGYELHLSMPGLQPVIWHNNALDPKAEKLPTLQMQEISSASR